MADIKDKISKLLALAESPNENEARLALLKARELMAEYKLTPDEIVREKSETVKREVLDIKCTKMTNAWIPTLANVIAAHYCCKAYLYRAEYSKTSQIGLIGLEDDFDICKKIVLYAVDCVISGTKSIQKKPHEPAGRYRKNCNAYGWGFLYLACEKLMKSKNISIKSGALSWSSLKRSMTSWPLFVGNPNQSHMETAG